MQIKRGWKKHTAALLMLSLMIVPLLAACGANSDSGDDTTRVLRIATMYGDDRNSHIRSEYTDLFDYEHKNIEVEIVSAINYNDTYYGVSTTPEEEPDPVEKMRELMESSNPPDIVMLSFEEMSAFIDQNLLQPLDTRIADDGFSTEGFAPAVLEGLTNMGNGRLYGLAPTFSSYALIYNMEMFQEHGITMPYDGMTWDEVFNIARQFAALSNEEDPFFGFNFTAQMYTDFFYDMNIYTAPLGLQILDDNGERMMVNSPQWEQVWSTIYDLHSTNAIPGEEDWQKIRENRDPNQPYGPFDYNAFLSGRVAMTLMHHNSLDQIINANRNAANIEGFDPIVWDVVSVPYHPEFPNVSGNVSIDPIFAINANAQNPDDAWEFIKFVNGDEWAKLKSKSSYSLVSRVDFNEPRGGVDYNIDAFFSTKPATESLFNSDIYRKVPDFWRVQSIGQQKLREVLNGDKSVKQALEEWENEGNQALQEMKENQNGGGGIEVLPMPRIVN